MSLWIASCALRQVDILIDVHSFFFQCMCHSLSITVGPGGGHSIRQFVEFEAKQSGSILIFALSDEARLMRALPRIQPGPAARFSRLPSPSCPLIGRWCGTRPSYWPSQEIWSSLSRVMENLNIQQSPPPAKYQSICFNPRSVFTLHAAWLLPITLTARSDRDEYHSTRWNDHGLKKGILSWNISELTSWWNPNWQISHFLS